VDNNYLDLGMNKSGFVHTLPSGKLTATAGSRKEPPCRLPGSACRGRIETYFYLFPCNISFYLQRYWSCLEQLRHLRYKIEKVGKTPIQQT
jgi:hypothetical protein